MGPYLTDANWHGDICLGNICPDNIRPGSICPYQKYLSCYGPNFDKTFRSQFFAGAARRTAPASMLILCVSVYVSEIISWPLVG